MRLLFDCCKQRYKSILKIIVDKNDLELELEEPKNNYFRGLAKTDDIILIYL